MVGAVLALASGKAERRQLHPLQEVPYKGVHLSQVHQHSKKCTNTIIVGIYFCRSRYFTSPQRTERKPNCSVWISSGFIHMHSAASSLAASTDSSSMSHS